MKAMALVTMNFESAYLNSNHEISVILPDKPRTMTPREFFESGRKYKVLWLLHGTFGDHSDWIRKSNIELYACERDLIVVMPSALNSNYSDWPESMMGFNMFSYLTEELMPLIYNWFPASDKREDNFVAGLSMGGGGTIKYAVNHPDKFAAAAILSSCARNPHIIDMDDPNPRSKRNIVSVKNAGGLDAYINSYENVWDKLKELSNTGTLPRLYFACGKNDFLYNDFVSFRKYAESFNLDATFEEIEGYTHEWRFWDLTIQKALTFFGLDQKDAGNPF